MLVAAAAPLTLTAGTAQAQPTTVFSAEGAEAVATAGTTQSAADVQRYWTEDRMLEATPAPEPAVQSAGTPAVRSRTSPVSASRPGSVPATATPAPQGATTMALTYFWQSKVWAGHGTAPATTMGKLYSTTCRVRGDGARRPRSPPTTRTRSGPPRTA
ncbi:hypothetical protein [Actinomadura alba]|uniref:hypothetical protein n=1 Tax=Actinomadura alba TaxID=406431 RepID=UPI0031D7B3B1